MSFSEIDKHFMQLAIAQAQAAHAQNEVPVGAVLVMENQVIAQAANQPIASCDPSAHAEILVLRQAASVIQNYRLLNSTLYVTIEPCAMCAGALIHARIQRLVFGAHDPKAGAVGSITNILELKNLNHRVQWQSGLLADECGELLKDFFKTRR